MPKTLLLADDSVTIQKVVGITFANEDVELVTVDNGTDALSRAKQVLPDLVLADIGMPGMTGYELCAAIRRTPELARIPVLLLTGTFESYDEAQAARAGASGHISKPFEAQALVDRVWALLAEAESAHAATRVSDPLEAIPVAAQAIDEPDDPLEGLPELPNCSFDASDPAEQSFPWRASAAADDLFEPPGLVLREADPDEPEELLLPALPGAPELPVRPAQSGADPDPANSETAFLDPLDDLMPAAPRPARSTAASLLPPAEAPDFLDPISFDAQGDTNPTYADGSSIAEEGEAADDPHVASGESLALVIPEIPDLPGVAPATVASEPASPLLEIQPVADLDPIDLELLETPELHEATLRANEPERAPAPTDPTTPLAPAPAPLQPDLQSTGPTLPLVDTDALHAALEKLAWEAFGTLSQELVEQFTRRLEAIVWEVVPSLAERLVREEIARLKGDA